MENAYSLTSYRALLAVATVTAAFPLIPSSASAQDPSAQNLSALAKREMIRRMNDVEEADELFKEGRKAYAAGDFQMAVDKFSSAKQKVPNAPLFADRLKSYDQHLTDASVALAMVYREEGRLEDAETIINDVLAENPTNEDALKQKQYLADPLRTNPALTPEYTQAVAEVNNLLIMADSAYMLGKYDEAKGYYEKILLIDKYNVQARRGLERVAHTKSDYQRAAYDHTRMELLQQVDEAWELAVPDAEPVVQPPINPDQENQYGIALITEKLRRIKVNVTFDDTTVEDAIEFLRQRAFELDTLELDPDKKGVNFVVRTPRNAGGVGVDDGLGDALGGDFGGGADLGAKRIPELRLRNVPLEVALEYICEATDLRYKIDNYAVTLVPKTDTGEEIYPRTFTVPPDFRDKLASEGGGSGGGSGNPFETNNEPANTGITALPPVDELLKKSGISFPDGASATLTGNKLLVSNTPTELDKIEQLVNNMTIAQPKQVRITTKFVEVTQENGDELGFDWVVGPFFSGDGNIAGSGGVIGNASRRTGIDFSGPNIPGVNGSDVNVSNIVTSGNRSGDFAITGNTIDAILNNPTRATQAARVAPGIMSLTGLFSDGQLKVIMRGLSQKKGVDLMTAPSITARSGETAIIEIIREFIYPTEYDPPELQQGGNNNGFNNGGGGGGGGVGQAQVQAFPVVPANPTAFETRNTGVTLEIEPNIGDNDFMINLRFVPEIVEFEGFINYGSPIQTAGTDALGNPVTVVITENRIEMPIFATRRVNSSLTIYDGYTVAIGGLMREDVQNVEDKVPVLGDIPLVGRLFQTKAERRIKSNLIIFVKAQIIDPTGRPIRGSGNESDDMTPMAGGGGPLETAR